MGTEHLACRKLGRDPFAGSGESGIGARPGVVLLAGCGNVLGAGAGGDRVCQGAVERVEDFALRRGLIVMVKVHARA
jgi:hypothetical protein